MRNEVSGIRRFLILIPLLGACAPAVSGGASTSGDPLDSLGPFKLGQTWHLNSNLSTSDSGLFADVDFFIQSIDSKGKIVGTNMMFTQKVPLTLGLQYNSDGSIFLSDIIETKLYGGKTHVCFIPTSADKSMTYAGALAYINPVKLPDIDKIQKDLGPKYSNLSTMESAMAIVKALAPSDNGSCTLELIK
ncbi:hypothetical protein [Deinococcus sp.]|uniref:hypothetical protein n=1 Tax=Deinococcus sp. TaxID=47478 RepID=UPI003CC63CD2